MDADRFDLLTKSIATPANRRRALGLTAGGFLGAFLRGDAPVAAQRTTCTLEFVTAVRQGPSASQLLTDDAALPGEARGELSFSLSASGALEDGVLRLSDGTDLPVVGQATGNSLQMRIDAGQGIVFVAIGVGEQDVAACQGAINGIMSGPQAGDLGDWQAVALGQGTATSTGGGNTGGPATGSANRPAGGQGPPAPPAIPPSSSSATRTCPANQTSCSGTCVNLSSDLNHCGECGAVCESRLVAVECRNGVCEGSSCENGLTFCGAADGCRDTTQDIDHCGGCQQPCVNADCAGGVCIGEPDPDQCGVGLSDCGGVCVDLDDDDLNCGECGNDCYLLGPSHYCERGVCTPPSCGDLTDCGGLCVDLPTDPLHCGTCGNTCAAGQTCQGGECTGGAPPAPTCEDVGLTTCNDFCVDVDNDGDNCGACGNGCGPAAVCQGGMCVTDGPAPVTCNPGLENCFGTCVDTSNDALNCGGCGVPCPAGQFCQSRVCVAGIPDCGPGLTACGGICLDVMTNAFACGACTNVCGEGQSCQGGECIAPPA
ncbi:MAG: hypothetical protein H0V24_06765 [Chloroflexia bacterium]|nr:hypothetical protein [Chloroflexia bacterium]